MTGATLFPTLQRAEPFHSAAPPGQAIAAMILLVGAVAGTAWASWPAVTAPEPPAACAPSGVVTSDQLETASLRIRYADAAGTNAAYGGSAHSAAEAGLSLDRLDRQALLAARAELRAAREGLSLLCARASLD